MNLKKGIIAKRVVLFLIGAAGSVLNISSCSDGIS